MTEELKPCPFCGGTDIMSFDTGAHWVSCQTCGAEGPVVDDREDAVAKWNERQTVVVAQGKPRAWMAEWDGNIDVTIYEDTMLTWRDKLGRKITPLFAGPAERQTLSEQERHAVEHARFQADRATSDDPECCFDFELVKTLVQIIDRRSPAVGGKKLHKSMWQQPEYDPELSLLGAVKEMAAPQDGPECPSQPETGAEQIATEGELVVTQYELAAARTALRPFAACIYDDNGDITLTTSDLRVEHYMRAKSALTSTNREASK